MASAARSERRRDAFETGLARYARGDFFAAHEALEPAWMGTDDLAERALHQGLIKVAAAYVHAVRHNPAGHRQEPHRRPWPPRRRDVRSGPPGAWTWTTSLAAVDARLADPASPRRPARHPEDPDRMNRPQAIPAVDPLYADIRRRDPVRPAVLLDVRERDEFATVRIDGSLFIPMSQLGGAASARSRATGRSSCCAPRGAARHRSRASCCRPAGPTSATSPAASRRWERMGLPVRRGPVEPGEGELPG